MTAPAEEPQVLNASILADYIAADLDDTYVEDAAAHVNARSQGPIVDILVDPDVGETKRFYFRIFEGKPLEPIADNDGR